jgi:hypothetical protein
MMDAIFLLAIAIAYWAVRELVLNTFKKVAQKKLFIIGFAFVGLSIAIAVVAGSEFLSRAAAVRPELGWLLVILCPSSLLQIVFIDIPHPSSSSVMQLGILIALMNSALYAAIGGRVGWSLRKTRLPA